MSFHKPKEEPKYEDVSLDEFVLVAIMQYLQSAHSLALEKDYEGSLEACDYVYSILPAGVAPKDMKSPLDQYQESIKALTPEKDIRKIIRLTTPLTNEEAQFYAPLGDRIQAHKAKYLMLQKVAIAKPLIRDFRIKVRLGLEAKGLYIQGKGRVVTPTSELTPEGPLPVLAKLGRSQPR